MTVPVIFVGHGGYAAGVRDAAEMILGEQEHVGTVSLPPNGSLEQLGEDIAAELTRLGAQDGANDAEALVLADLMGGSPSNAAARIALTNPNLHLVSGLNLPMVLEVLTSIEETAAGLAGVALHAGREGVQDVAAQLREAASKAGK
ncbi:MAG TPA: PTS mannose transporter subunit IIAB [Pseudonocardiaceae bacterium]|nr:PTS mannose transporter subunit IIAB [Pseudonocardiaceae bacterium]